MNETQSNSETGMVSPWRIEGALTIYTVETLRAQMAERLARPEGLEMDLSGVSACDCAGLQLLCSARKSAEMTGARFHSGNFPPVILAAAEGIGLDLASLTLTPSPIPV